ncbi:hypothetical protein CsSME_00011250 [Camellia sinensis var. sinensis]
MLARQIFEKENILGLTFLIGFQAEENVKHPFNDNQGRPWGCVFLGEWTPESVGDYASGTNHVLPTYGYARMYGGVSLDSFLKYMTVQSLTGEGLTKLGPYVATMAEVEGLEAHKRAVTLRLQEIEARRISQMR